MRPPLSLSLTSFAPSERRADSRVRSRTAIESEIRRLTQESQKGPLSKTDKDELARLRADLARLNKAKQECASSLSFPSVPRSHT